MSAAPSGTDPQTYAIIGAAMEVHRVLGPGFLEAVYQEALAIELTERAIPFAREVPLQVRYKGRVLAPVYRADFVCYDRVIAECKAQRAVGRQDDAQLLHYLTAAGRPVGLLINFGAVSLEWYRRVM